MEVNGSTENFKDVTEFVCLSENDIEKLNSMGEVLLTSTSETVERNKDGDSQQLSNNADKDVNVHEITSENSSVLLDIPLANSGDGTANPSNVEIMVDCISGNEVEVTEGDETKEPQPITIDSSNPIYLSDNSIVTVEGKKCILHYAENLQQMIAYPIIFPTKPRGRPRKAKIDDKTNEGSKEENKEPEQFEAETCENDEELDSAGTGLVQTVTDDGLLVVRSSRKRKKAKTLKEYETGKLKAVVSDMEASDSDFEPADGNNSDDNVKDARKKRKIDKNRNLKEKLNISQNNLLSLPFLQPVKRSRGRPKRYGVKESSLKMFVIQMGNGKSMTVQIPESNIPKDRSIQDIADQLAKHLSEKPEETLLALSSAVVTNQESAMFAPIRPAPMKTKETELGDIKNLESDDVMACDSPMQLRDRSTSDVEHTQSTSVAISSENDAPNRSDDVAKTYIQEEIEISNQTPHIEGSLVDSAQLQEFNMSPINREGLKEVTDSFADVDHKSAIVVTKFATEELLNNFKANETTGGDSVFSNPTVIPIGKKLFMEADCFENSGGNENIEKLTCDKCEHLADSVEQLEDHLLNNHQSELFMCKACDQFGLQESQLMNHFKRVHRKLLCWICNHMSENSVSAKKHMSTVHESGTPICEICNKVYKNHHVLKMHIKMVHIPATVLYECNICSKNFNRKPHLKRHLRTHNPKRSHKCTMCDYSGIEKSDLNKHMVVHDEPKEICYICGHAFRHSRNLSLHMKRHLRQKDYKCGICSYYGYTFTDIRKHIERRHKDNKTILCNSCGYAFKDDNKLKEHHKSGECKMYTLQQAAEREVEISENLYSVDSNQVAGNVEMEQELISASLGQPFQIIVSEDTSKEHSSLNQITIVTTSDNLEEQSADSLANSNTSSSETVAVLSDNFIGESAHNEEIALVTNEGTILKGIVIMDQNNVVNTDISATS